MADAPSPKELKQALMLAMLNVREQGGDEADLDALAALADDPDALAELVNDDAEQE